MDKTFVRKNFFTKEPAQVKFLSLLLVSMLLPAMLVGSFLYFLIFRILSHQDALDGSFGYDISSVMMKTNLAMIAGFVILFLALFAWGVIITHRFAGPLGRLKKEIDMMAESDDLSVPLSVRKNDYLKPLVDSINKLIGRFSKKRAK